MTTVSPFTHEGICERHENIVDIFLEYCLGQWQDGYPKTVINYKIHLTNVHATA